MTNVVYIVHVVDTEGPLTESLDATFGRLKDIFGISLEPSREALRKIQNQEFDFGSKTKIVSEVFSPHMINYNDSWDKIDLMLKKILSKDFRNQLIDSFGQGWVYNWFCVDHVGYEHNPRRRDMGYHNILDFFLKALKEYNSSQDGLYWHFHPMSFYKEAHRLATSYVNSPHLYEVLCRRIIEKGLFSPAVRAGFQTERPDSHLFFEQWIPFDFTNWSYTSNDILETQNDMKGGRSGDWRLAPDDWSIYQPHHDNWQLPGNCRRWIARSIDMLTRAKELSQSEVDKAFRRAGEGHRVLMAFNNHDTRDMAYEVDLVRKKINIASNNFPDVKFKFCDAVTAFRELLYDGKKGEPVELDVKVSSKNDRMFLSVDTTSGKVFGPQPFLAIQTRSGRFIHDNLDFDPSLTKWSYTFDYNSIRPEDVHAIGVAANDKYGNSFVKTYLV